MKEDRDLMYRQFYQLGEMMGDGLHHEEPWISKEYAKLLKILYPPTEEEKAIKREIRQKRNKRVDEQVAKRLENDRCVCGGVLKQTRLGSKTVKCVIESCQKKYTYRKRNKIIT